jgi:hypothetical protein
MLFASAAATLLAGWHASSFTSYAPALRAYWIVFGVAAVAFVLAGVVLRSRPHRGPLLAASAAVVLAGWAVTTGYGPVGAVSRPAAALGMIAAAMCVTSLPRRARWITLAVLGGASVLLGLIAIWPFALPVAALWIYAVIALGGSFAAAAVLPRAAYRSTPVVGVAAIIGWLVGAGLLLLALGLPLSSS